MKKSVLNCSNCGANIKLDNINNQLYICEYCGTSIVIDYKDENTERVKKVKVEKPIPRDAKRDISHKDFIRQILIALCLEKTTPHDVCNCEFGEVKESFENSLVYEVEFTYKEKKYKASAFASGETMLSVKYPQSLVFAKKIAKEKNKKWKYFSFVSAFFIFVSLILGDVPKALKIILTCLTSVCALAFGTVYILKSKKGHKSLCNSVRQIKIETLKESLEKYNLTPLTDEEIKQFNNSHGIDDLIKL